MAAVVMILASYLGLVVTFGVPGLVVVAIHATVCMLSTRR